MENKMKGLFLILGVLIALPGLVFAQSMQSVATSYPTHKTPINADSLTSNTNIIYGVPTTDIKPTKKIGESPSNKIDTERQQISNYCKYTEGVRCNLNKKGYLANNSLIMRQYFDNEQMPHFGLFRVIRGTKRTACDGKDKEWNGVWNNGTFVGKVQTPNCLRKTINYEQVTIGD